MKKIIIPFICFLAGIQARAQEQITITGNMKLYPGTSMTVFGNFKNDGAFVDSGLVVNFSGPSNQVISGTSISQFRNAVIDNTTGVTLNQSIVISTNLNLVAGSLRLNSNDLNIISGLSSAVTRINGFIVSEQTDNSSRIIWSIGTNTGAHIFPFGVIAGEYIPFTFDLVSGDVGNITLATYNTTTANMPLPVSPDLVTNINNSMGADNSANLVDRFWQIGKSGVSGNATMTFTAQTIEVGTLVNLKAQRWNISTQGWDDPLPGQTNGTNTAIVGNVTSFSPWVLSGNDIPLPIELLTFTAKSNNDRQVDINWSTSSEVNNDFFTVEKTSDGIHFEIVAEVDGAGNSNQLLNYYLLDSNPYMGMSYYRLKQTDFNGNFIYSDLASVKLNNQNVFLLNVFPNPTNGNFSISISGAMDQTLTMTISDMNGRNFYTREIEVKDNNFIVSVETNSLLVAGTYHLQVFDINHIYSTKLIVY
jgi:hypothetical protein